MFYWQRVMRMTFVFQFLEMNQDQLFFFSLNLFIGSDNGISIFFLLIIFFSYLFSSIGMVYLSFVDFEI